MEPKIWGPPAWKFLHSITFQYPENPSDIDKQRYYTFFNSLKYVLPCPNCQEHYSKNFDSIPIKLEKKEELIEWLIDIHNEVNKLTGKKVYPYEKVYQEYSSELGKTGNKGYLNILFILILILIFGYYYYKNYYLNKN